MIPNLKPGTTYAIHLRAATNSGSKDWVGSVTGNGEIHTFWGKTGCINQHAAKPGDLNALNRIIDSKVKGPNHYQKIDDYEPILGWQSQRKQAQPSSPPKPKKQQPPPEPIVDWSNEAPDNAIDWDF